jgi:hypothetical protein
LSFQDCFEVLQETLRSLGGLTSHHRPHQAHRPADPDVALARKPRRPIHRLEGEAECRRERALDVAATS